MKVKELVPQLNKDTFIDDYLRACGVEEVEEFKNPKGAYLQGIGVYYEILDKATTFLKWVAEKPKIFILVDSDVDGLCSATLAYEILKSIEYCNIKQEDITFLYHTDKTHGLTPEIMEQLDKMLKPHNRNLIIIPDAGSNDVKQMHTLLDKNKSQNSVVVLDHHKVEKKSEMGLNALISDYRFIIVNNQLETLANKSLCGTGVVFKFFQAMCKVQDTNDYSHFIDLVAFANISDVMDMRNLENIVFNKWGLWLGAKNPFIVALCDKYCNRTIGVSPENISWDIAPKLNAVCRSNDQETKSMVVEALCGIRKDYDDVIKAIERCYRKQREFVKEMYEGLVTTHWANDSFGKVVVQFCDKTPFTGLIANKLAEHYNKPTILVHEEGGKCSGSCRSQVPIREQVKQCRGTIYAMGHDEAFGIAFMLGRKDEFIEDLEKLNLNICLEQVVAATLNPSNIPTWLFYVTERYARCWGTKVEAPKFYVPHLRINASDILEHANGTTLKFTYKGIEYLKFFASKNDKEHLSIGSKKPLTIDLLGSLGVNRYNDQEKLQVKIDKFEIVKEDWSDLW